MRVRSFPAVSLIASLLGLALGLDVRPASADPEVALVSPRTSWQWQVITAPRLAPQLGALAVSGLDVVAGRAPAPLDVLGAGAAPVRWPFAVERGARTLPAASAGERIAAAFGVTTFELTSADEGLEMLELRVRYEDGLAAWLNGTELVRSGLPRAGATGLARRPHGPEWETFYLPVGPGLLRLGTNVLAIEVRPSGRRDAPTAAVELVGRRDRGIVRGPVLAEVGSTTARIVVETDPDTAAVLVWSAGSSPEHRIPSAAGRHHTFALTGLPARGKTVRYRIHAGATRSASYEIHTQPAPGDVIRIGIYGDVRGGHAVHRALVEAMRAEPLDAIGVTGDLVLRGTDEADWQRFFAITQPLLGAVPYLPAIGNHDLGWGGVDAGRRAEDVFTLPPGPPGRPAGADGYSLDVADVHLVFLDSNAYERVEQEAWLEADLAAARARKVRAILVLAHDGPYSRGYHGGNALARARIVPILVRHRIDLLMSGHDHLYQRGEIDGIRYVVTGGGGAPLYAIRCGHPGKPACKVDDGMQAVFREHHFLVLTLDATALELCARRPDGRLLEKCTRHPLHR